MLANWLASNKPSRNPDNQLPSHPANWWNVRQKYDENPNWNPAVFEGGFPKISVCQL